MSEWDWKEEQEKKKFKEENPDSMKIFDEVVNSLFGDEEESEE
ncbi:MAG: hypothetical protein ACTSR8_15990 [Promethearchaeota archaeon]